MGGPSLKLGICVSRNSHNTHVVLLLEKLGGGQSDLLVADAGRPGVQERWHAPGSLGGSGMLLTGHGCKKVACA